MQKKKPVFLIVQHLSAGGIEVLALNLLEKLKKDNNLHIIALEGLKDDALKNWPILNKYKERLHFLKKRPGLCPLTLIKLISIFARKRPQTVHTHHIGPLIYGGFAARLTIIDNIVHTEHDGWHLEQNGHKQSVLIKLIQPKIIAVARHVAQSVKNKCGIEKPDVIYNGVDTRTFTKCNMIAARHRHDLPKDVRLIGCAGRLEKVKGHKYLIESLKHLPSNFHVTFAGDGTLKEQLKQQADNLGLQSRVHFLGRIDDMPSFYRSLDVFCLPSLNEGFPLSPLEAQACGIPTIVSNVGGSPETICPDTGMTCKSADPKDLAQKIIKSLNHKEKKSPRDFILKNFCLEKSANLYKKLYERNKGEFNYV